MSQISDQFLALLAHELRTPIAAIIGYHDFLSEGILGPMEPRVEDAIQRMRGSADQLLALVASLGEAGVTDPNNLHVDIAEEDPCEIAEAVVQDLKAEASGRATNVDVAHTPKSQPFVTDRERVHRAMLLAMHAAIKNTAGGHVSVHSDAHEDEFVFTITGANLDPARDSITNGTLTAATAAAMRLAMAEQAIKPLGGTLVMDVENGQSRVTIRVPESTPTD